MHELATGKDSLGDGGAATGDLPAQPSVGVSAAAVNLPPVAGGEPEGSGGAKEVARISGGKTGWPAPELMQDDCRPLFRWFADRMDSRRMVRLALETQ